MRMTLLVVFGAVGTLARYGLQGLVQYRTGSTFPTGTLVVNLIGCLLLGGVAQFGLHHIAIPPEWRIALTVGFFGAFTTFSTFSWETVQMLRDGEWAKASLYIAASLIGGLAGIVIGMRVADAI